MKNSFCFFILMACISTLTAQNSGKGFSYQAVARSADGHPKRSANIELQFSLFPGAQASSPTWQEAQVTTTDNLGIFALIVGKGIKSGGTASQFKDVDFSSADYWLKIELRENNSWVEISFFQLPSVPYAEALGKDFGMPVGSIIPFAGPKEKIPTGWMLCDGATLSRSQYANLYAVIGTAWGHGDGANTFHLPDLRGLFLRGVDYGRGKDDDRNNRQAMNSGGNTNDMVGSLESEDFREHNHSGNTEQGGNHTHRIINRDKRINQDVPVRWQHDDRGDDQSGWSGNIIDCAHPDPTRLNDLPIVMAEAAGNHRHIIPPSGGKETRPDNANVNYIIKF